MALTVRTRPREMQEEDIITINDYRELSVEHDSWAPYRFICYSSNLSETASVEPEVSVLFAGSATPAPELCMVGTVESIVEEAQRSRHLFDLHRAAAQELIRRYLGLAGTGSGISTAHSSLFDTPLHSDVRGDQLKLRRALLALQAVNADNMRELEELLNLPPNWDLEGGREATPSAVTAAAETAVQIYTYGQNKPALTSVSAAVDGGVEMTWEGTQGRELFIVVPPDGHGLRYVYSELSEQNEYEDSGGVLEGDSKLKSLISKLAA